MRLVRAAVSILPVVDVAGNDGHASRAKTRLRAHPRRLRASLSEAFSERASDATAAVSASTAVKEASSALFHAEELSSPSASSGRPPLEAPPASSSSANGAPTWTTSAVLNMVLPFHSLLHEVATGASSSPRSASPPIMPLRFLVHSTARWLTLALLLKFACITCNIAQQLAPLPRIQRMRALRHTDDASPLPFAATLGSALQWILYGSVAFAHTHNTAFLLLVEANVLGFLAGLYYCGVYDAVSASMARAEARWAARMRRARARRAVRRAEREREHAAAALAAAREAEAAAAARGAEAAAAARGADGETEKDQTDLNIVQPPNSVASPSRLVIIDDADDASRRSHRREGVTDDGEEAIFLHSRFIAADSLPVLSVLSGNSRFHGGTRDAIGESLCAAAAAAAAEAERLELEEAAAAAEEAAAHPAQLSASVAAHTESVSWWHSLVGYVAALAAVMCIVQVAVCLASPPATSMTVAGLLAASSSVLVSAAPFASVAQLAQTRDVNSMPVAMSVTGLVSSTLWVTCAVRIGDGWLLWPNVVGMVFGASQIIIALALVQGGDASSCSSASILAWSPRRTHGRTHEENLRQNRGPIGVTLSTVAPPLPPAFAEWRRQFGKVEAGHEVGSLARPPIRAGLQGALV